MRGTTGTFCAGCVWRGSDLRTSRSNRMPSRRLLRCAGGDFLRAWADAASAMASSRTVAVVDRIRADLVDSIAFPAVVDWFLKRGWRSWAGDDEGELLAGELETWRELHDDLVREHGGGRLSLNVYLQQMDLVSKAPRPGRDAVRCMTVHGSKRLGFRHVYLIGMAQEVFPSFQALRKGLQSRELEEEAPELFRRHHARRTDVDAYPGGTILRVPEETVAVSR